MSESVLAAPSAVKSLLLLFLVLVCSCSDPTVKAVRSRSDEYHRLIMKGDARSQEFNLPDPTTDPKIRKAAQEAVQHALEVAFQMVGRPEKAVIQEVKISDDPPGYATVLVEWHYRKKDGQTNTHLNRETWKLQDGIWFLSLIQNES